MIGGIVSVRASLTCIVLLLSALVVGCGDDDDGATAQVGNAPDSGDSKNPPMKARVEITKSGYRPRHVRILVGGTVTFVNMDRDPHTAETGDLPEGLSDNNEFDTHVLTWEEPYTVYFHKPETVEYRSSLDPEMIGTVEAVPKQ
jgi:plastocyanin